MNTGVEKQINAPDNSTGLVRLLIALAFFSGCTALAYEILYIRALTTLLGDMFYVHAALLSSFLVGIGLGAKLAHRWDRWLFAFEILTGLYALGFPGFSNWLSGQEILTPISSSPLLTIFSTVAFISIPSFLIGFSIPLFSSYIKAYSRDHLAFQGVYTVYNLGALLSIFFVEFVLVRRFGITLSLAITGAVNLLNGVVLLLIRGFPERLPSKTPRVFQRRFIIALALASLSSAVFQMFFLKLSYLVFQPHRENFAVGLSVILLGIFLGAWIGSKVRIRFETFLVLIPGLIGLIYVNYLPILHLYEVTAPFAKGSQLFMLIHKFFIGCIFALGPMIVFGALLPALMRSENQVAEESGHLLWISSLANAAGYLTYVLLGHPFLTTGLLLTLIAGLGLVASLIGAGFRWSKTEACLALAGVILVFLLTQSWQDRNFYLAQWTDELKPEDEVIIFKSGAESATLVQAPDRQWISYNGHPSITVEKDGAVNFAEIISGIIPGLGAPRLDRALVLGLGTGITAGATSQIFKATDVVEINYAFYKMMPLLRRANLDIEHNKTAALHLSDGRAFLIGKEKTYDAIINSIPAPTYFSASKIYTLEFYDRVMKALKPDGIFCTWLSVGEMSESGVKTVLSALASRFRYCDLRLLRGNYYMVTCSNRPIQPRKLSDLPAQEKLIRDIKKSIPNFEADEFFEDIRLSENLFDHFVPRVSKDNTDDHPVLEFMLVKDYQLNKMGKDMFVALQSLLNIDPVRQAKIKDSDRLVRRAGVFFVLNRNYFNRNFLPLLRADHEVWKKWEFWRGALLKKR